MTDERTLENAPELVREVGGVSLSLWLTGAGETDVATVARMQLLRDATHGALSALDGAVDWHEIDDARRALRAVLA